MKLWGPKREANKLRTLKRSAIEWWVCLLAMCGAISVLLTGCVSKTSPSLLEPPDKSRLGMMPPEACSDGAEVVELCVIGLSDFHGWLSPHVSSTKKRVGGIVRLAHILKHQEKIDPEAAFILDNGDMWTGPAESTLLFGKPVVQAYNVLGVSAVNVANHEFDFGIERLQQRIKEARFPFLSANIRDRATLKTPAFLRPWILVERAGVKIGVIGLSFVGTHMSTRASHVRDFSFAPYRKTLERIVPQVQRAGAELMVLLIHDTVDVAKGVLAALPQFEFAAVVAGENHQKERGQVGRTPIVNPGPFGRSFVRFDFSVSCHDHRLLSVRDRIVDVTGGASAGGDPMGEGEKGSMRALQAIVKGARANTDRLSGSVLAHLSETLAPGTFERSPLGHLIVDAWLAAFPEADVAILNHGAIRQPLAPGPVRLSDLVGVLPFENELYIVKVTGAELKSQLETDHPVVGGVIWTYRQMGAGRRVASMVDRKGKPIRSHVQYRVLVADFVYTGGDGYRFHEFDPSPNKTGVPWRLPVVQRLKSGKIDMRVLKKARARSVGPSRGP